MDKDRKRETELDMYELFDEGSQVFRQEFERMHERMESMFREAIGSGFGFDVPFAKVNIQVRNTEDNTSESFKTQERNDFSEEEKPTRRYWRHWGHWDDGHHRRRFCHRDDDEANVPVINLPVREENRAPEVKETKETMYLVQEDDDAVEQARQRVQNGIHTFVDMFTAAFDKEIAARRAKLMEQEVQQIPEERKAIAKPAKQTFHLPETSFFDLIFPDTQEDNTTWHKFWSSSSSARQWSSHSDEQGITTNYTATSQRNIIRPDGSQEAIFTKTVNGVTQSQSIIKHADGSVESSSNVYHWNEPQNSVKKVLQDAHVAEPSSNMFEPFEKRKKGWFFS
ncbi:hypothetical protein BZG36_00446 [Bifiguratus adelaidae]|uniref:Uncharacterized protein n=1 Tax=Bifiguratus adelaidae TaxID=1938954 RepID=A0A261Y7L1_9FUNG|nr:hypothetical protein BZG36_00446 [Bifiguratus adelaidae]